MVKKKRYPVIFTTMQDAVLVEIPDLEILTEGRDYDDAVRMARDAIGLKGISMEDAGMEVPEASDLQSIDPAKGTFAEDGEGVVSLVDIDFTEYRNKKFSNF